MESLDKLLTVKDLAADPRVSRSPPSTLGATTAKGPPGFRVGRHVRYRRADVEQWISDRLKTDVL